MMTAVSEAGLVPDMSMFSDAVEACARGGDKEGALHFWEQAFVLGLAPDERMLREVKVVLDGVKGFLSIFERATLE